MEDQGMSASTWHRDGSGPRLGGGLYRDSENGWLMGVCAGIAECYGYPVLLVRLVAFVLLWFLTLPTVTAYFVLGLLLPERPLRFRGRVDERSFWERASRRARRWAESGRIHDEQV